MVPKLASILVCMENKCWNYEQRVDVEYMKDAFIANRKLPVNCQLL